MAVYIAQRFWRAAGVGSLTGAWLAQLPAVAVLSLLGRSGRFADTPAAVCHALLRPASSLVLTMQRCDVASSEEAAQCFAGSACAIGECLSCA